MPRVLLVGGYGAFGARIAERLARLADLEVTIAGRSLQRAQGAMAALQAAGARAHVAAVTLDALQATDQDLRTLRPDVLIHAAGPY
ncbi:MAG TPA: saccharopine dehydrogenase NADP-binding domain-containing protein [Hyphomicrobiaceae bacterium]|nr:saccharopine dehydrogenase NADP-binding domain-containing protein [Hyphomicrobiaceae bacterium]